MNRPSDFAIMYRMKHKCDFKYAGAMVLGMHDALVEITGIIAGLAFTMESSRLIVMTGIIAAVAASLSMAAANYMAQRTDNNPDALRCACYTGAMYLCTSAAIIAPFCIIRNHFAALATTAAIAVLIILIFNIYATRGTKRTYWKRTSEMLVVCMAVSIVSFLIGQAAKYFLGVTV